MVTQKARLDWIWHYLGEDGCLDSQRS